MGDLDPPLARANVLVTGGCGFIGSHLVRHLLAAGASRITVVDSLRSGRRPNLAGHAPDVPVVPFTLGVDAPERLRPHLRGVDYVFHLAALKHNTAGVSSGELLAANVDGTCALLELAADEKVRKVVFASSVYAYGRAAGPPLVESEPSPAVTVYGISKLCGELLLEHFRRQRGLHSVALRYFFVFGPGQAAGAGREPVIPGTLRRLLRRESPVLRGDGAQVLDYVYVDDVCRATLAALAPETGGVVLNVGSGQGVAVRELVEAMIDIAGRRLPVAHEPADDTAATSRVADISRIRGLLGWSPEVSLPEGLRRTLDSIAREP